LFKKETISYLRRFAVNLRSSSIKYKLIIRQLHRVAKSLRRLQKNQRFI